MTDIKVTITVEIVESDGHTFTLSENAPDAATGDNPLFFTQDVERGIDQVAEKLVGSVAARFGDVRTRRRA